MLVYVLGDAPTQYICDSIKNNIKERINGCIIKEAEYNQIELQILNAISDFQRSSPDYTIIYMCSEKLLSEYYKLDMASKSVFADTIISRIKQLWDAIKYSEVIQFNFVEIETRVFGNYSARVKESFEFQIRKLNVMLAELAIEYGNYIYDLCSLQNRFGRSNTYNITQFYIGKVTISTKYVEKVASGITDIICSAQKSQVKCIILDLDNTLWGGVIGDDGINNIEIGDLGKGRIYSDLQSYFLELKKRGIILCVCSKNDEENAIEPFEKHPDMILSLDDISVFVANWNDKASNIKYIKETLNIGYESIVFIDDNPVERGLVRNFIQDIIVPDLPKSAHKYLDYLIGLNLFEISSISLSDCDRGQMYKQEFQRKENENSFQNIEGYLESLDMECEIKQADEFNIPRIAQLTQRSNQFNLRTIRYSESDMKNMAKSSEYRVISFNLSDKYGDYGLISAVILKVEENIAFIDTFIMSCRVLKRTMEQYIINKIVEICEKEQIESIKAEYKETKKNGMVKDLYSSFGFEEYMDNNYVVCVKKYMLNNTKVGDKRDVQ